MLPAPSWAKARIVHSPRASDLRVVTFAVHVPSLAVPPVRVRNVLRASPEVCPGAKRPTPTRSTPEESVTRAVRVNVVVPVVLGACTGETGLTVTVTIRGALLSAAEAAIATAGPISRAAA